MTESLAEPLMSNEATEPILDQSIPESIFQKEKKPRTPKQIEAMKNANLVRIQNAKLKQEEIKKIKSRSNISTPVIASIPEPIVAPMTPQPEIPKEEPTKQKKPKAAKEPKIIKEPQIQYVDKIVEKIVERIVEVPIKKMKLHFI